MKKALLVFGVFALLAVAVAAEMPAYCNDGVVSGDETGVDCGGSCPICTYPPKGVAISTRGEIQNLVVNQQLQPSVAQQTTPTGGTVQVTGADSGLMTYVRGIYDVLYNTVDYVLNTISTPLNTLSKQL